MENNTCANCQNHYFGSFCNQCGQKTAHRYTVAHVFHELVHVFTHADKGIFAFARQMLYKAGFIARDFVEGKRKRHFNLFQYLLIILGLATLLLSKTGFMERTLDAVNETTGTKMNGEMVALQRTMIGYVQKYFNLVQFIMIPIFSFFSWIYIRKNRFNYAENIVLHAAVTAQLNSFTVFTSILLIAIPSINYQIYAASFITLTGFCYTLAFRQFYQLSWGKSFLYMLLTYLSAYVIQIILFAVLTVVLFVTKQHVAT